MKLRYKIFTTSVCFSDLPPVTPQAIPGPSVASVRSLTKSSSNQNSIAIKRPAPSKEQPQPAKKARITSAGESKKDLRC